MSGRGSRRPQGSERRPRDRRPVRRGVGEPAARQQRVRPPDGRPDLEARQQAGERRPELAVERRPRSRSRPSISSGARAAVRASPTARSGASGPARSTTPWSTPWTCRPPSTGRMWPPLRSVLFIDRVEHRHPPQPRVVLDHHGHDVDLRIGLDEGLDHALAERPVAQDRRRHDPPAGRLGDVPRGDLAAGQGAVREVVERPLAEGRLVDRVDDQRRLRDPGRCRVTVTSIALFDDSTIRPTTSISPSRRTSSVVRPVEHGRTGLVDVVAVAPRADVALRVERRAAQRARRPAGGRRSGRPARRTIGPRRRSSGRAAGRARPRPRRRPRRDRSARRPRTGRAPRPAPARRRRPSRASASRPGTPR